MAGIAGSAASRSAAFAPAAERTTATYWSVWVWAWAVRSS